MATHGEVPLATGTAGETTLKRSLNLPLLVLYGLGTTIGAGIYVLVGAAAGRAGLYAPVAFFIAALGIAPTAIAYAEFAGRYPVSAGEAAYVRAGFRSTFASIVTGWLVILSAIVASATIAIGSAGYIRTFVDIPAPLLVTVVLVTMGIAAAWGILESVIIAALFTLIEAGGLAVLIGAGFITIDNVADRVMETLPLGAPGAVWLGIANAGLLAVFAFIGFEDIVNVAEETRNPRRTVPWAIFLTLIVTTVLYVLVAIVAVLAVEPAVLAQSEAPLSDVFRALTGWSPAFLSVIAIFATLNTILVQIIMASRVVYGMAAQKTMPGLFAHVNPLTRTPVRATVAIVLPILVLALAFPLERLAEFTSLFVLVIWVLANAALILVKLRGDPTPKGGYITGFWVPVVGLLFSFGFIAISILG